MPYSSSKGRTYASEESQKPSIAGKGKLQKASDEVRKFTKKKKKKKIYVKLENVQNGIHTITQMSLENLILIEGSQIAKAT